MKKIIEIWHLICVHLNIVPKKHKLNNYNYTCETCINSQYKKNDFYTCLLNSNKYVFNHKNFTCNFYSASFFKIKKIKDEIKII